MNHRKLGELLQQWHTSSGDPIYRAGSLFYAGKPVDVATAMAAGDHITKLLNDPRIGESEHQELRQILKALIAYVGKRA